MAAERFGWCWWCDTYSWRAVLIDWHDTGSGPRGREYFACPDCRERHGLVAFVDRPLNAPA